MKRRLAGGLAAGLITWTIACGASPSPSTDETAYTLPRGSLRAGLWKLEYSAVDSVTAGTYWWAWYFGIINGHVKWRALSAGDFAVAARFGALHVATTNLGALDNDLGDGSLTVATGELTGTWRAGPALTVSLTPVYTKVWIDGEINVDAFDGTAAGAVDNLQLVTTVERRLDRRAALGLTGRYLVFQNLTGRGLVRLQPDAYTHVDLHGGGKRDAFDFPHAWSLVLHSRLTFGRFNLRLGIGYGNHSVPALNFVRKTPGVIPELDAYWVF
ncbi:MAG: hypothetical protein KF718_27745 [Polyangiaceae bacterium]|nr:hypothetical protein [Polyangiaceae bacterium]